MSTQRVIVIGTGADGLTASAFLATSGFEVVALERSSHVGGPLNPYERQGGPTSSIQETAQPSPSRICATSPA
jgi:phytoene dehydrogenase-like protein